MRFSKILATTILLAWGWPAVASAATATTSPAFEIVVLGSGGPGATGRASSSYALLIEGVPRIIVDAGSGGFVRLGEAKLSLGAADIVLLTHLHIDHTGELPGLFKARAVASSEPITFNVWGPDGSKSRQTDAFFPSTSRFLELLFGRRGAFAYLRDFSAPITVVPHDLPTADGVSASVRIIVDQNELKIRAIGGHHGDAPAVVYRIDVGHKSVTFSGDIDALGLKNLRTIARGCDLLVFNSVVLDPPGSPAVLYDLHTPPHALGELARDASIGRVLLSHLSPAIDSNREAVLASIRRSYSGPVSFAEDGMRTTP